MWNRTSKFVKAKKFTLEANVLLDIPENSDKKSLNEHSSKFAFY